MGQVGIFLSATKALTTFRRSLLLITRIVFETQASTLSLVFSNALSLGFLVRGGFSVSLGLGLGSLLCLLALYFGIFGGIPGVKDLDSFVRPLPSFKSSPHREVESRVCKGRL
jgi:hypothetical protein